MALSTPLNPRENVIARVRSWAGIKIHHDHGVGHIMVKDRPIGRFPSNDALEAVLCGTLRPNIIENVFDLPDGVWPTDDQHRVYIDLTTPAGLEEAIRVLLNAYLAAQGAAVGDWHFKDSELTADPSCAKAAAAIDGYRSARNLVAG